MAQPAGGNGSHVIDIDIDGGGAKRTEPLANQPVSPTPVSHIIDVDVVRPEQSECAVCMEPLEWVVIGPCGHREVCSKCAVQICVRSRSDRRCSICREPCPAVVVTKSGGGRRVDTKLASLGAFQGRVGEYWYHSASAAYFDDEQQYEAAKKAYLELEGVNMQVAPCDCVCSPVARILLYVAIVLFVGVIIGVSTGVINIHQNWGLS